MTVAGISVGDWVVWKNDEDIAQAVKISGSSLTLRATNKFQSVFPVIIEVSTVPRVPRPEVK